MRQYPRRIYKGADSKSVFDETEEIKAASEGWNCAANPEKIALKEAKGKGILRSEVKDVKETIVKESIKDTDPVPTEPKSEESPGVREEAEPLSPQQKAAITRKNKKRGK